MIATLIPVAACNRPAPRAAFSDFSPMPVYVGARALNGVTATWPAQGPAPITGGQAANLSPNNQVIGAIRAIVPHPTDPNTVYIAAVNGGIWRTTNAQNANPSWTALTDQQPSLSMGALAIDPANPSALVGGFGTYSSFGGLGTGAGGLLSTTNGGSTWTSLTPAPLAGRSISSIEIRGATWLVASDSFNGGVFRSTDSGGTFTLVSGTNGLGAGQVSELVGDRSTATRFYAAVLGVGVFRSDDSGQTWTNVSQNDASAGGLQQTVTGGGNNRTRLATGNDGRVYAAVLVNSHLQFIGFSTNQGGAWTAMDLPRTNVPGVGTAISNASNTSPIVITTSANHGLPLNNSNLFVRITGVTGNTAANGDFRIAALNKMSPLNQFTLLNTTGNGNFAGGGSWIEFDDLNPEPVDPDEEAGGQGGIHFSLTVDPGNSAIVYVGGDRQDAPFPNAIGALDFSGRLFRGNAAVAASGAIPSPQWAHLTDSNAIAATPLGGTASSSAPHADSRFLVFDAAGNLLESDDGGVFRRTSPQNNTGDWFSLNNNLQITELHDIAFDPVSSRVIGGAQDTGNPQQTGTGALVWNDFTTADGGDVQVDATSAGPGKSIRYTSTQNFGGPTRTTFDSAGNKIASAPLGLNIGTAMNGPQFPFRTEIELNKNNPQRLVLAASDAIWESTDQGDNIVSLAAGGGASAMAYGHSANVNVLWAGVGSSVLVRTTAMGALAATTTPFPGGGISDIVLDTASANSAYVSSNSGATPQVFRTTDTGANWTDITGDLTQLNPGQTRTIAFVPGTPGKIFVGTDTGVYVTSLNSLGFWNRVGAALPRAIVFDMDYAAGSDTLYVGTMGRGAWSLASASTVDLPPAARCRNVNVNADASCKASVSAAQVDNGSSDPDGQPVTLGALSPPGPYTRGTVTVTLPVSSSGGNESCTAQIKVSDVTPPTITAPSNRTINVCVNPNLGTPTVADNCGVQSVVNNAPAKFPLGTTVVTWTVTDVAGNTRTANQTINAVLGDDASCCPTGTHVIVGTSASDQIVGTSGSDCILGRGGDDVIDARGGNDFISGGAARDQIFGGDGNDRCYGGDGDDTINCSPGNNFIDGGNGTDTCFVDPRFDTATSCNP